MTRRYGLTVSRERNVTKGEGMIKEAGCRHSTPTRSKLGAAWLTETSLLVPLALHWTHKRGEDIKMFRLRKGTGNFIIDRDSHAHHSSEREGACVSPYSVSSHTSSRTQIRY
jgi:hypothetical protein